jgi:uridine kinase
MQVNASDVVIMEGILVFHDARVRELMNMKIFVDTGQLCAFCLQLQRLRFLILQMTIL